MKVFQKVPVPNIALLKSLHVIYTVEPPNDKLNLGLVMQIPNYDKTSGDKSMKS